MTCKRNELVGTSYAARLLGVSEVRVRQLAEAGKLKVKQRTLDGRRLYDPAEITRLRKAREQRLENEVKRLTAAMETRKDGMGMETGQTPDIRQNYRSARNEERELSKQKGQRCERRPERKENQCVKQPLLRQSKKSNPYVR